MFIIIIIIIIIIKLLILRNFRKALNLSLELQTHAKSLQFLVKMHSETQNALQLPVPFLLLVVFLPAVSMISEPTISMILVCRVAHATSTSRKKTDSVP